MASEVMSSALLMIATIIAAVALINAVFPSVYSMAGSITSATGTVNDRMKSDVKFIYETTDGDHTLTAWIKNTGKTQLVPSSFNNTDIFFGESDGVMTRAVYNVTTTPSWNFTIESDNGNGRWDPGETMKITIVSNQPFVAGSDYKIRAVLYNGVFCEDYFTV